MRGWAHINQAQLMYQVDDLKSVWWEMNITIELEKQTGADGCLRNATLILANDSPVPNGLVSVVMEE
jgi:hypothetical protein